MNDSHLDPKKRHDFVFFFDAKDSNPNGDPDAGNMPRVDPETMQGLVTDVCIKRKIRKWIDFQEDLEGEDGRSFDIFIQMDKALNEKIDESEEADFDENADPPKEKEARQRWMCDRYYDVRTFGAVLSTGENEGIGRITGPMQLTISRSVDPVTISDLSITRQAATKRSDFEEKGSTMGRKPVVLYGLYRGHGFYNPKLANGKKGTGFDEGDLKLFWQALGEAFRHDKSALRNQVNMREIFVFSHDDPLGNAPAHELFRTIRSNLDRAKMEADGLEVPRKFEHYEFTAPDDEDSDDDASDEEESDDVLPDGVTLTRVLG